MDVSNRIWSYLGLGRPDVELFQLARCAAPACPDNITLVWESKERDREVIALHMSRTHPLARLGSIMVPVWDLNYNTRHVPDCCIVQNIHSI